MPSRSYEYASIEARRTSEKRYPELMETTYVVGFAKLQRKIQSLAESISEDHRSLAGCHSAFPGVSESIRELVHTVFDLEED